MRFCIWHKRCSSPEWGWLRRVYQPRRKRAVSQPLASWRPRGTLLFTWLKGKYSSMFFPLLILIKQICFFFQALCWIWEACRHEKIQYWGCYDWLDRSWFIKGFSSEGVNSIDTWIQIQRWRYCTVLTSGIHSNWFFTSLILIPSCILSFRQCFKLIPFKITFMGIQYLINPHGLKNYYSVLDDFLYYNDMLLDFFS